MQTHLKNNDEVNKKTNSRLSDEQKEKIKELYVGEPIYRNGQIIGNTGLGTRKIAKILNLNQKTVYNFLKREGLVRAEDKKVLQNDSLNGENVSLKNRVKELEKTVNDQRKMLEMQHDEIEGLKMRNKDLREENERLWKKIIQISNEYNILRVKLSAYEKGKKKERKEEKQEEKEEREEKKEKEEKEEKKEREKREEKEIIIKSPYNVRLITEIKKAKGKWDAAKKVWKVISSEERVKEILRNTYCYDTENNEIVMKSGKCCKNFKGLSHGGRHYCRSVCLTRRESNKCYNLQCKEFEMNDKFRELNEDEISQMISSHSSSFLEVGYENHNNFSRLGSRGVEG